MNHFIISSFKFFQRIHEEVAGSKGPKDNEAGSQSLHHEVAGMMLEVLSTNMHKPRLIK